MTAISPVVQVVTGGGTDWPAIVAAISTGVVGLAGIGGTVWGSRRSINAEDARARLAQKRLIYADCLTAIVEMIGAAADHRTVFSAADRDPEKLQATESRIEKARDAMYQAFSVVDVGGSDDVSKACLAGYSGIDGLCKGDKRGHAQGLAGH